jgi:IS605 OrfB family transposase
MHKTSRFVINYCLEHKIGRLVIGKNDGWKKEIDIGKRNNQNFVCIPFDRLVQQIQYKARLVGIQVTIQEESVPFIQKVARLISSSGYLCYPFKATCLTALARKVCF